MFHYDHEMREHESESYGINHHGGIMYRDSKENPLINAFGIYILTRLHTFQNMKSLRIDADTDIPAYVRHSTELLDGSRVYRFSRELLAFLETLVAFCPYHVANNPNAAGPADAFYEAALARYKKVPYDKFHDYIAESLCEWYERFKPDAAGPEDEEDAAEEDGDRDNTLEVANAGPAADSVSFSLTRKSLGAPAVGAAPSGGAAAAAAGAAGTAGTAAAAAATQE
jgi:hypothetical protein